MAKSQDLFDITLSKDGSRMVAKLNAKKLTVTAYDDEEITLERGDYLDIKSAKECRESNEFLLTKEYINQEVFEKKQGYLDMVGDSFRARVSVRKK